MPIDLRKEMDQIIDQYGHAILLHRTNRKIRCRCWSEKNKEAKQDCPLCAGTGWVSRIERHNIRNDSATQVVSRPDRRQQAGIGKMWVDAQLFYMKYYTNPQVDDKIYEVGWNGNKPTHLMRTYVINDVVPNRGDNGRIEFWDVAAKSETTNMGNQQIFVRSIGSTENYEFKR